MLLLAAWLVAISAGTPIVITTDGTAPFDRQFVSADDDELVAFNAAALTGSAAAQQAFADVVETRPELVTQARHHAIGFELNGIQVLKGGVTFKGQPIGSLEQLVELIPRQEIVEVRRVAHKRSAVGAGVGAAAAVAAVEFVMLPALAHVGLPCEECSNGAFVVGMALLVAPPVAAGIWTARANAETVSEVLYVR
jgi:hypothetical protein